MDEKLLEKDRPAGASPGDSLTGHLAAKALKLSGCSDDKVTKAVEEMGDAMQAHFAKLLTGVSNADKGVEEFNKEMREQVEWNQARMSAATDSANEMSRMELNKLKLNSKYAVDSIEAREVVILEALDVAEKQMKLQHRVARSELEIRAAGQRLSSEQEEREQSLKIQQQYQSIISGQAAVFDEAIQEAKADPGDSNEKTKVKIKECMKETQQATCAHLESAARCKLQQANQVLCEAQMQEDFVNGELEDLKAHKKLASDRKTAEVARLNKMAEFEVAAEVADQSQDEDRAKRRVKSLVAVRELVSETEILTATMNGLKTYDEARAIAWQRVKEILKCTDKDLNMDSSNSFMMRLARFCYLGVIIGCELDTWGFMLGILTYWEPAALNKEEAGLCYFKCHNHTLTLMHCLLIAGPLGYVVAMCIYMCSEEPAPPASGSKKERLLHITDDPEQPVHKYVELPTQPIKKTIQVEIFHICPIIRNYLLVKEPVPDDVEALFRANSLSTFTLGFAQISCMILGVSKGWLPWPPTTILWVGIVAQVVNFFMTYLYFATSVPVMMQMSTTIEAMIATERHKLQCDLVMYNEATQDYCLKGKNDKSDAETLKKFHLKFEREIKEHAHMEALDVSSFTMEAKIGVVFYLRSKKINQFISMCKLGSPYQRQTGANQ